LEIVPFVLEGSGCGVRVRAYGLPNRLTILPEAKIVDALVMGLGLAIDQGIPRPEGVIFVPDGIQEGVVSFPKTDSNVETNFQRSHRNSW
jgi:hypothetical protein